MKPIIILDQVNKTYHNITSPNHALQNCTLSIMPKTFTCIVGKSGCGKSTLLNSIGGLIEVDSGTIIVQGRNLTSMKEKELAAFRRQNIGFIFQFFNLLQEQTIIENLMIPFDLNHERVDKAFFEEVINDLELTNLVNKFPHELSGGEQQRVSIARALIRKPAIILADEPTGNLDRENTKQVIKLIRHCQKRFDQTILMVTHDIELAKETDALIYMEDGRITHYEKNDLNLSYDNKDKEMISCASY